jgi:ribosomal-protein-alanine N-acetyltransferase
MSDRSGASGAPVVVLRPLVGADLPVLVGLERALFGAGAWSAAMLAEELDGPGRSYLGAELAGELVGYAGLWFDGVDAQVMTVGTAVDRQGQGVGRLLLRGLLDRARAVGARSVLLEVRVDNDPAVHLYTSEGFVTTGRRRRYYQPEDVDALTMALDLGGPA